MLLRWNTLVPRHSTRSSTAKFKVYVLSVALKISKLIRWAAVFTNVATVYPGWLGYPFTHWIHVSHYAFPRHLIAEGRSLTSI